MAPPAAGSVGKSGFSNFSLNPHDFHPAQEAGAIPEPVIFDVYESSGGSHRLSQGGRGYFFVFPLLLSASEEKAFPPGFKGAGLVDGCSPLMLSITDAVFIEGKLPVSGGVEGGVGIQGELLAGQNRIEDIHGGTALKSGLKLYSSHRKEMFNGMIALSVTPFFETFHSVHGNSADLGDGNAAGVDIKVRRTEKNLPEKPAGENFILWADIGYNYQRWNESSMYPSSDGHLVWATLGTDLW